MNIVVNILAAFSELIGLLANWHQLRYVVRKKSIHGISGWAWTLGTGGNAAWTVYGFQKRIIALVIANGLLVLIGLRMLQKLYRVREQRARMMTYSLAVGMGLSVVFISLPQFAGWLALFYSTLSRLPQLYRAYSDKNLSGLSIGSQITIMVENSLASTYAVMLGAYPLMISAAIGFFGSAYMTYMVAKKGKTT